jgi:lysophospholipase L1-like esterase
MVNKYSFVINKCSVLFGLVALGTIANVAFAQPCPDRNRIPDFNCDGSVQVLVLGDSLVSGFGDTVNDNSGGYVQRAQRKLREIGFMNRGVAGQRTFELIKDARDAFNGVNPPLRSAIESADIVVVDLGRNDRWLFGEPISTYRNLKRIRKIITQNVKKTFGYGPLVVNAVLMLPNRGSQGPWVKELNEYILRGNSLSTPSDLRFDLVSKRLLGFDQVHPTSEGYSALAKVFVQYLTKVLPERMRKLRPDADGNGVPDLLESAGETSISFIS